MSIARAAPEYVIGVDESGTGAFAGPFTVCAFMSHVADTAWITEAGARDSKTLSAPKRRVLCEALAPCALIADIAVVPGDYEDQAVVYTAALLTVVGHCASIVDDKRKILVQVDGARRMNMERAIMKRLGLRCEFVPKGDQLIPQISAASIFAKTVRTAVMAELHLQFPMYGWAGNDGYGTQEHRAAIELHGICALHRKIRPLLPYFSDGEARRMQDVQDRGGALR